MHLKFFKYQGTGNDFILIDNRDERFIPDQSLVAGLCDRHFGIGADGLIILQVSGNELIMRYFNSDGLESTMCGNGGRCFASFTNYLGLTRNELIFKASDGYHSASIQMMDTKTHIVRLSMNDVSDIKFFDDLTFVDSGSPHVVKWITPEEKVDVVELGRQIRNQSRWGPKGVNVNFVACQGDCIFIRTYERGVENETLSCGTGTVAAAVAAFESGRVATDRVIVKTRGGDLIVEFTKQGNRYTDIFLEGPAVKVFSGDIEI